MDEYGMRVDPQVANNPDVWPTFVKSMAERIGFDAEHVTDTKCVVLDDVLQPGRKVGFLWVEVS